MAVPKPVTATVSYPTGRWFTCVTVKTLDGAVAFETPLTETVVHDPATEFGGGAPTVG